MFSPRAWRCFLILRYKARPPAVFSTCVEVFPFFSTFSARILGFLHVRGGVSWCGGFARPRSRVFSTCVEVFLASRFKEHIRISFLHVRGGVSRYHYTHHEMMQFSPRAWRCFCVSAFLSFSFCVFSTCVEVFLQTGRLHKNARSFLHVRGGVSYLLRRQLIAIMFSPLVWRCFAHEAYSYYK